MRGLDYYTRTVFEWRTSALGSQDAVCSGGRYDGLVEQLGGEPTPAIGWALGIERIVGLMQVAGQPVSEAAPAVYLVLSGERAGPAGLALAERLRDALPGAGVLANMDGGSFKAQLKRADKSGAELALIIGDDEIARGVAAVKWLRADARAAGMALGRVAAAPGRAARPGQYSRKITMVDEYLSEREQAEQLRLWLRQNGIWLAGRRRADGRRLLWLPLVGIARGPALDRGGRALCRDARRDRRRQARRGAQDRRRSDRRVSPTRPMRTRRTSCSRGSTSTPETSRAPKRALRRSPTESKDPDLRIVARLRLARVQLAEGRYDEALKSLDAVATPAVDARVLELKGDVKLAQGDKGAALDYWRKAQAAAKADPVERVRRWTRNFSASRSTN